MPVSGSSSSPPPRLLLIGWDSADWRLLRPLMAAGKMPHLQRLVAGGVSGNLSTLQPMFSPMLWTSIATGKRAFKHGVHGFTEPDPATGGVRPVTSLSRTTKAIWNILSQAGRRCNVVGWWPSHPAEPINGVMVSNHFQEAVAPVDQPWPLAPGTVHPVRLAEHLAPLRLHPMEVAGDTLLPFVPLAPKIDQAKDKRLVTLAKLLAENATIQAAATGILQLEPWDFMAVYFDGLDHFGHAFMAYHPPRQPQVSEADFELYQGVVEGACRFHDLMLGTLLQLAGPNTRVLLISDHGFHCDNLRPAALPDEPAGPAHQHRDYGLMVMAGPGIKQGAAVAGASLLDIAPTILHSFGLPVGEDMDGNILLSVFENPAPVERIPSWDAVPGEAGLHPAGAGLDPHESAAALQRLVALGYIEEPNADRAVAAAETSRELRYNLAVAYMDGRHFHHASRILQDLWEDKPGDSRFGVHLLRCHLALRQPALARTTFTTLEERCEASARRAQSELEALRAEMTKASGGDPSQNSKLRQLQNRATVDRPAMEYFRAQVLLAEERFGEAKAVWESLIAAAAPERRLDLHSQIGEAALNLQHWDEARNHFRRVLELDPEQVSGHLGLARYFLARRRPFEAAAAARRALELNFQTPLAHFFYGVALAHCGHADWAAGALQEAVRQAPAFPGAHRRLANLFERRLNNPAQALYHREMALRPAVAATEPPALPGRRPPAAAPARTAVNFHRPLTGKVTCPPREWITAVSGLPRSGTSMMMQILAAGGIAPLTDEARPADASNEKGYFEYTPVKRMAGGLAWLADAKGKAVKIVVPLVRHLPPEFSYKIIFMERPITEVLASQTTMIGRLGGRRRAADDAVLAQAFALQEDRCRRYLADLPNADCITVDYHRAIAHPAAVASDLAAFLGVPHLSIPAMIAVVCPSLHRERKPAAAAAGQPGDLPYAV